MGSQDFEEFIAVLNAHGAKYIIVGAHAVAFHARPRATTDLDILIQPTPENAQVVLGALRDFFEGADLGYTVEDLINPRWMIQLGTARIRIALISDVPGCDRFESAWERRIEAQFGATPTNYMGLEDLISTKEASGRAQDLADVEVLVRARP